MKVRDFDDAFSLLMGSEGGFSINAADPGNWTEGLVGRGTLEGTMWGITVRVARANGYAGPMKDLPQATARQIAKKEYWDPLRCDELPPELAYQVFDVNYNGGHAAVWLQTAVGAVPDGVVGAKTVASAAACDVHVAIMRFDAYCLQYLARLKVLPSFAAGWMNRVASRLLEGAD